MGLLGKEAAPWGAEVVALLGDAEATVVMAAVACVGRVGGVWGKHCVERLVAEGARERAAAAEALGLMGGGEYVNQVAELLMDSDWQVPVAAASALKRMRGAAKSCHSALRGRFQ